ncbi:MAG: Asp/Glu racemase [Betaproteobacteria bacterium]|nr:Asp/Glu racemase [Betaproteobacteria bacterium]
MPVILAINPNTTAAITDLVAAHLQRAVGPDVQWRPVTGRFGARYISAEASYTIAGHAALEVYAMNAQGVDAVLLACFGDPGLFALREIAPVPVIGLAEASMNEAAQSASRFSIVTGGPRWAPMLYRLAESLGFAESLVSVRTLALTGVQIAADPDAAIDQLADECRKAGELDGVGAVILGGAGLAGLAARVQPHVDVRLIDNIIVGARHAERLARGAPRHYERMPLGAATPATGIDPTLALFLRD